MNKIYFSSDLHFCHNREFLYEPRGFSSVQEMNKAIIENFNSVVDKDDDLYLLGDLMLNDNDAGMAAVASLNGRIHLILGNHDTVARQQLYQQLPNLIEMTYAIILKYGKYHFYLSHYPTLTGNDKPGLRANLLNLYGHTHQKLPWSFYSPYMYNVGVDAHNCKPIEIEDVISEMREFYLELSEVDREKPWVKL